MSGSTAIGRAHNTEGFRNAAQLACFFIACAWPDAEGCTAPSWAKQRLGSLNSAYPTAGFWLESWRSTAAAERGNQHRPHSRYLPERSPQTGPLQKSRACHWLSPRSRRAGTASPEPPCISTRAHLGPRQPGHCVMRHERLIPEPGRRILPRGRPLLVVN